MIEVFPQFNSLLLEQFPRKHKRPYDTAAELGLVYISGGQDVRPLKKAKYDEKEKVYSHEEVVLKVNEEEHAEAEHVDPGKNSDSGSIFAVMKLAYLSIGVVYGDIGTSPMYVFPGIFSEIVPTQTGLLGAVSLIIYSLTLFPLIKYVFLVLRANDRGDGGTLAMYSLLHRHLTTIQGDEHLTRAGKIKAAFQRSLWFRRSILSLALLGTCMVIGDGIFTPCISVLSAVEGARKFDPTLSKSVVVAISVMILVGLFLIQRFGTHKVGFTFAPIIIIWYLLIGIIGVYNMITHDATIVRAINPMWIYHYFAEDPKQAWLSLGGVVLCMTGTEAMFADLGHFSVKSIQVAFAGFVYPCLLCTYMGQASYLTKFPDHVHDSFYNSIPKAVHWPMFVVAVLAAIIASQSMITATFSVMKQSMELGCFPRVHIVHTSRNHEGQIYIPKINFFLMIATVTVTASFQEAAKMADAYGIAMMAVMSITTLMLILTMLIVWESSVFYISLVITIFGSLEMAYFSALLSKFKHGGYIPIAFAGLMFSFMYICRHVKLKNYTMEAVLLGSM